MFTGGLSEVGRFGSGDYGLLAISGIVGLVLGIAGSVQNTLPEGVLGAGFDNPSTFEYLLRCLSAAITEEILFRDRREGS